MSDKIEKHLEAVDEERRGAVLKLVRGAAFVVPVVASFALQGRMSIATAGTNATASGSESVDE
jgi:hypothetical protein